MTDNYAYPHSRASLQVVPLANLAVPEPVPAPPSMAEPAPLTTDSPELQKKLLEGKVIAAISKVFDPEIPVNIYELGLIYGIDISDDHSVKVRMTLTSPGCPVAGSLPGDVEKQIEAIPEVKEAEVELVWEPTWTKDRMSEAAMLQLNLL